MPVPGDLWVGTMMDERCPSGCLRLRVALSGTYANRARAGDELFFTKTEEAIAVNE